MRFGPDPTTASDDAVRIVDHARRQTQSAQRLTALELPDDYPTDLFPGYTVVAKVSSGGQGTIYEAIEHTTQRRVAIKVLRSGPFCDALDQTRFEREVRILGRLQHPHIVTIHTSGTVERHRYFVMDFIEGKSLDEFVQDGDLSIADTLALFLKIVGAIDAAHVHGITHRDLKPANILVDRLGNPHVLDFGLAITSEDRAGGAHLTTTGQFVGSLRWAAPEQLHEDPDSVDLRTDVYGLGLCLYFMLTQSLPYDRFGIARNVMDCIIAGDHAPPSRYRRDVDDELDAIVLKCLQVAPDRRYEIAGAVAHDIKRYLAGEAVEAKRDSPTYLFVKTIRRHRTAAMFVAALLLSGVGYMVTLSVLYERAVGSELVAQQRTAAAQEQYRIARESLEFLVNEVLQDLDAIPGTSDPKHKLLRGVYERLNLLASEHGDDPAFLLDLIQTLHQLGSLAVELCAYDDAQRHFESEMNHRQELPAGDAELPENQSALSINHVVLGDLAQRRGDMELCAFHYETALDIDERLVGNEPGNASFQDNLGWSYDRLGALAFKTNKRALAGEYYQKRRTIAMALVAEEPKNTVRLHGLASAYGRLAELAAAEWDWDTGMTSLEAGCDILRRILLLDPADCETMRLQVGHLCTLSYYRMVVDPLAPTADILFEAEALANSLVELEKELPRSHWLQASVRFQMMDAARRRGDDATTVEYAMTTLESVKEFERRVPPNEESIYKRAKSRWNIAEVYRSDGERDSAREQLERAVAVVEGAFDAKIDSVKLRLLHLGLLPQSERFPSRAVARVTASVECLAQLSGGSEPWVLMEVAKTYSMIGEHELAVETLQQAKDELATAGKSFPEHAERTLQNSVAAIERAGAPTE